MLGSGECLVPATMMRFKVLLIVLHVFVANARNTHGYSYRKNWNILRKDLKKGKENFSSLVFVVWSSGSNSIQFRYEQCSRTY